MAAGHPWYSSGMTAATHVETERKYETSADAELPELRDVPGVTGVDGPRTEHLEAIYFDTADSRLARHGATLRRRTGGADAGWHLKVPAGPDSRTELRLPLDGRPEDATNAPPDELADLALAMVRGAEIRPVARLRTERRVWQLLGPGREPLAEVTDDRVTARRLGQSSTVDKWRELEVELADPAAVAVLDGVEEVLLRAGVRRARHSSKLARVLPPPAAPGGAGGDTAGDAVLAYVRARFDEIVAQDLWVRRDAPDAVHRMRVAIRRLRSALRVYRRVLPGTERLLEELRWLGGRLAEARDLEVQSERFRSAVAALPDDLVAGPVTARLTRHFGPAEAAARDTVVETLGDKRYRRLLDELDRLLADPPRTARAARPAAKELRGHVKRAYRKTRQRLAADSLHQARKAAKRYRYALEVAEPAVGAKARRARKAARALTKLLGEHQDGVVAQPVLRELGMRAHADGENGFTFGLLHGQESARCAAVEEAWPRYWERVRETRLR
jgi:CHAD domain-containing protein